MKATNIKTVFLENEQMALSKGVQGIDDNERNVLENGDRISENRIQSILENIKNLISKPSSNKTYLAIPDREKNIPEIKLVGNDHIHKRDLIPKNQSDN